jgi:hypothetical protein
MTSRCYTTEEERNSFIAFITWIFPSSLESSQGKEYVTVVVDTPVGMLSWYVPMEHKHYFKHLPENMNRVTPVWTDEEKYDLLIKLAKKVGGIVVALGMLSSFGFGGDK